MCGGINTRKEQCFCDLLWHPNLRLTLPLNSKAHIPTREAKPRWLPSWQLPILLYPVRLNINTRWKGRSFVVYFNIKHSIFVFFRYMGLSFYLTVKSRNICLWKHFFLPPKKKRFLTLCLCLSFHALCFCSQAVAVCRGVPAVPSRWR